LAENEQFLNQLVANSSESLGIELKEWLDPNTTVGKAKLVKACLALRNNNGGCLLVGFNDDGTPRVDGVLNSIYDVYLNRNFKNDYPYERAS